MKNISFLFKRKTIKFRHFMIRLIAPTIYRNVQEIEQKTQLGSGFPRPMIKFIKQHFNDRPLIGVEIGVFEGANAENILELLNIKTIILIDPYMPYSEMASDLDVSFEIAKTRLRRFSQKVQFIKKKSEDAVNFVPENIDFVYIDGGHSYQVVKKDIQSYYPKIKKGGVLGGHDYWFGHNFGVVEAVNEFVLANNLKLLGEELDWWIVKPS